MRYCRWADTLHLKSEEKAVDKRHRTHPRGMREKAESAQGRAWTSRAENPFRNDVRRMDRLLVSSFCKPGLRDSTRTEYENAYHHIIPSVGHLPLYKLTQNDLGCSRHPSISVSREILPRYIRDSNCSLNGPVVNRFASTICATPSQRWRSKTE